MNETKHEDHEDLTKDVLQDLADDRILEYALRVVFVAFVFLPYRDGAMPKARIFL